MSFEIIVMPVNVSPKVQKQVRERIEAKVCVCGCGRKTHERAKRGLSEHCYNRYSYLRRKIGSKRSKAEFDARLIQSGLLLERFEILSMNATSSLDAVAGELI